MGESFPDDDHSKASQNAEHGPEADDGITEKMGCMPCCVKIEHHGKGQESKKTAFSAYGNARSGN